MKKGYSMEFRKGDLVVVTNTNGVKFQERFIGRVLTLTEVECQDPASWYIDGNLDQYRAILEVCIKKIENPGDDAVDETLLWLPVPTKEKQEA